MLPLLLCVSRRLAHPRTHTQPMANIQTVRFASDLSYTCITDGTRLIAVIIRILFNWKLAPIIWIEMNKNDNRWPMDRQKKNVEFGITSLIPLLIILLQFCMFVCKCVCVRASACVRAAGERQAAGGQKETDQIFILFVQFCDDETADSSPNLFGFSIRSRYLDFCTASDQRCFGRKKNSIGARHSSEWAKHAKVNRVSECGQTLCLLAYQFVCKEAIEHRLKPGELQIGRKAQTPAQISPTKGENSRW